jgi:predicted transcriptional regulator
MNFVKVKDHDGLVRDTSSGAILNTNQADYNSYMTARSKAIEKEMQFSQQIEELNNIKQDVSEIKEMLLQILAKKG